MRRVLRVTEILQLWFIFPFIFPTQYKGATIQLLDLPGIIEGASQGKGRGRQVIATARTAVSASMPAHCQVRTHLRTLAHIFPSVRI